MICLKRQCLMALFHISARFIIVLVAIKSVFVDVSGLVYLAAALGWFEELGRTTKVVSDICGVR